MAPPGPRYSRELAKEKIREAKLLRFKDQEIIDWVGFSESKFRKCKAGGEDGRGMTPDEIRKIDALIATRSGQPPPQRTFDFEATEPLTVPGSPPFDLTLHKVKYERVWMIEIRPLDGQVPSLQISEQVDLLGKDST